MTRKQAICEAIRILSNDKENQEICQLLQAVHDDYRSKLWSKESVLDAIDHFIYINGRFPAKKDFTRSNGLPSIGEIRVQFGIGYGEFREKYYKDVKYYISKSRYDDVDFWTKVFVKQIIEMNYPTEEEYNKNRANGTPHSKTMMNNLECRCWTELLKKCGVDNKPKVSFDVITEKTKKTAEEYQQLYREIAEQFGIEINE